jgi:hypothetical protein
MFPPPALKVPDTGVPLGGVPADVEKVVVTEFGDVAHPLQVPATASVCENPGVVNPNEVSS